MKGPLRGHLGEAFEKYLLQRANPICSYKTDLNGLHSTEQQDGVATAL